MEMLEEQRETWGTRGGFVLAAIGSAVGLGNLWGFPYKLYSYGGGAFLIPYILAIFCIGVPLLVMEFSLGHVTQRAAPDAFRRTHRRLEFVGWWGILLGFVIITYYPVILAYCFSFMWYSVVAIFQGTPLPWAGEGIEGVEKASQFFNDIYLKGGHPIGPLSIPWGDGTVELGPFQLNIVIPLILTWIAMYFSIFKGVSLVGKIVWLTVPLPWLILAVLAVRGLTLEGSMSGLVYYLEPDFTQLREPSTWRFAFGQVFFSLSLAFGVMVTYASFLHRKSDLNNNAAIIGLSDFATSFIAGIAIFATLGGMAYATAAAGTPVPVQEVVDAGPGLAFVAFPYALAQLPAAPWWSLLFFFTLATLGIDSAFSISESVLAALVDKTGWRRSIVLPALTIVGLLCSLLYVTRSGLDWLGTMDGFINGTWGIAFLGLLECLVLGWLYNIDRLRQHANERSDWCLGAWWNYVIRIVVPVVLATLFFWSLFDDWANWEEMLKADAGGWNVQVVVGFAVVAAAPVLAVLLSLFPSHRRLEPSPQLPFVQNPNYLSGRWAGVLALLLGAVAAAILVLVVVYIEPLLRNGAVLRYLLFQAAGLALGGVLLANYILDKYTGRYTYPSWYARWAGFLGTLDIGAFLAVELILYTSAEEHAGKGRITVPDALGTMGYIILSAVIVIVVLGLGWCFYRALAASSLNVPEEPQESEE